MNGNDCGVMVEKPLLEMMVIPEAWSVVVGVTGLQCLAWSMGGWTMGEPKALWFFVRLRVPLLMSRIGSSGMYSDICSNVSRDLVFSPFSIRTSISFYA